MNRIMVVDDEAIQRRVLGKMIRGFLPECEVVEAGNGKTALDIARTASFDVVITDIKMPIMDGFDFIEQMNRLSPATKIIFLSSYRYFEYAQRAIRLGAFDYVLKPVKEESISLLLGKVRDSIEKERRISLVAESGREPPRISLNAYYGHLLAEWVQSGVSDDQFGELRRQYSLDPWGAVVVTRIEDSGADDLYPGGLEDIRGAMTAALADTLCSPGRAVSFFPSQQQAILVSVLTANSRGEVISRAVLTDLREYGRKLSSMYQLSFAVGVGNVRTNLCREAADSYKEAMEAADFRYFLDDEQVVAYADISGRIASLPYSFHADGELFKEYIRMDKADSLLKHTDHLFHRLLENGLPYREQCLASVVRLVPHIASAVQGLLGEDEYRRAILHAEQSLMACVSFRECKEKFSGILNEFMEIVRGGPGSRHAEAIDKCLAYIEAHFSEDISLEKAAGLLFFSPNYLSMIFKSRLGVSFTKYLSDYRLEKAVQLLKAGDLKIYEVAGKAGFRDEKYFHRVFKAKFGFTPDEFRKKNAFPVSPAGEGRR